MLLTSSVLVRRPTRQTMSAIDPTGTGARIATPSNLPWYSGSALMVAFAAPVLAGTRLVAAARPRRRSLLGRSTSAWLAVYAWIVVIVAFRMPSRRPRISITGVMQFVVQLAHEMMLALPSAVLTPWTTVGTSSPPLSGAERMTNLAPAWAWRLRSASWVNTPVHSRTMWTARSRQGSWSRSF